MKNKGFILLISMFLLSAISALVLFEMSTYVSEQYQKTFDEINKEKSKFLALSCRNQALLDIAKDPLHILKDQSIAVASSTCTIVSIEIDTSSSSLKNIKTSASSSNMTTNLLTQVTIKNNGLYIDYSRESEKF